MIPIIGKLDTRIILQRATNATDGQGSVTKTWATLATVWTIAEALTATEATNGNERTAFTDYKFIIRHQDALATLSPADRVQHASINYDILSAVPMPEGRPDQIIITARRKA